MHRSVRPSERIDALDLLRGVAICGILLMNIQEMGTFGHYDTPRLPAAWDANWLLWGVQHLLFEGTMRGLFTMLFGAGMLLMLRRADEPHGEVAPIDAWNRRCLCLMALGVVQWLVLLWPGEILWNYGVTGLFLLAFRRAKSRTLLRIAAVLLLAMTIAYAGENASKALTLQQGFVAERVQAQGRPLSAEQKTAVETLAKARTALRESPKFRAEEHARRTHYVSLVKWSWGEWSQWNIGGNLWFGLMESGAFMMIGMALFRRGILGGGGAPSRYRAMMIAGYGGGLALRGGVLWLRARSGFDITPDSVALVRDLPDPLLYEAGRLLVTLGHVGLILTVWHTGLLGRAAPLRALGRMALTTYLLQSLLSSILFYAFGLVGYFGFAGLIGVTVGVWLATGLFASWWLRRHAMGPVEQLLRRVAYGDGPQQAAMPAVRATLPSPGAGR